MKDKSEANLSIAEDSLIEVTHHVQSREALDAEMLENLLTAKVGGTHVWV
jgi:hypothetical protein